MQVTVLGPQDPRHGVRASSTRLLSGEAAAQSWGGPAVLPWELVGWGLSEASEANISQEGRAGVGFRRGA